MKCTRNELINLNNALSKMGHINGITFGYARAKNMRKTKIILKDMQTALNENRDTILSSKQLDKLNKYYTILQDITEEHAQKDKKGNIIKFGDNIHINPDKKESFAKKQKELTIEYKEELILEDTLKEKNNAFLEGEEDFDLYQVSQKDLPKDIVADDVAKIFLMIKE